MQRLVFSRTAKAAASSCKSSLLQTPRQASIAESGAHLSARYICSGVHTSRLHNSALSTASPASWIRRLHQRSPSSSARACPSALQARRTFSSTATAHHGGKGRPAPGTGIKVTFKNHKGEIIKEVEANEGDDIVDLSWEYDLDIEAACEKSVACSTCHCILDPESYDKLEEPTDEENDMLDMAFGLEDTSRLGCQVKITKDLDGMVVSLPSATRNFAVDGHKPKPH